MSCLLVPLVITYSNLFPITNKSAVFAVFLPLSAGPGPSGTCSSGGGGCGQSVPSVKGPPPPPLRPSAALGFRLPRQIIFVGPGTAAASAVPKFPSFVARGQIHKTQERSQFGHIHRGKGKGGRDTCGPFTAKHFFESDFRWPHINKDQHKCKHLHYQLRPVTAPRRCSPIFCFYCWCAVQLPVSGSNGSGKTVKRSGSMLI